MPSRKFVWDPEYWRFRAEETRTVADQMTHEEARAIMWRIAMELLQVGHQTRGNRFSTSIVLAPILLRFALDRWCRPSLCFPLVAVVTGNFLHEHHDPAPHGGIINSHERSDQP
jgi:hypothetical protein